MKILIISDVHVGDYPNYETRRYDRLNQYLLYADRIVQIASENNIDHLFIAGDFMDLPVNSPFVLRVAKTVLFRFSRAFKKIYYIVGQHDLKSKNYDDAELWKYSITNVLAPVNMEYCDHKILELGGRKIAMMNFHPEPDLSWIKDKVDLFIGHVTINTNGFGSDIDYSKFDLGIAGDIHYPCSKENLHSVGISVPRYLGDASEGTSVIVDLEDMSWERVLNDPNKEWYTRYVKTSSWDDEGASEEKLADGIRPKEYRIYYPPETSFSSSMTLKEFSDERVSDINEIISRSVEVNDLKDIHDKVCSTASAGYSVDLNFELLSLTIENVRSIDSYTWDFTDKKGVYQIAADNGAGKTSLIWSLNYALRGGLDIRDEIREGCDYAYVYLKLKYQNKIYGIYRGTDEVYLEIDGTYQALGGKRDTESGIYELLPFLNYLDSFFFMDYAVSILESYSTDRRIELLSTYYRIDVIQKYYEEAKVLLQDEYKKQNDAWQEHHDAEDAYTRNKEHVEKKKKDLAQYDRKSLTEEYEKLKKEHEEVLVLEAEVKKLDIPTIKSSLAKATSDVLKCKTRISDLKGDINETEDLLSLMNQGVDHSKEELDELYKRALEINSEITSLKSEIKTLKSNIANYSTLTCPLCQGTIELIGMQPTSLEDLKSQLSEKTSLRDSKESEYEEAYTEYEKKDKESKDYSKYQRKEEILKGFKESLEKESEKLESLEETKETLEEKLNSITLIESKRSSTEILNEMNSIVSIISKLDELDEMEQSLKEYEESGHLQELVEILDNQSLIVQRYELYCQLFSNNGELYKLVLTSILNRFSSEHFKYEAVSSTYRGREFTDIVGYYKSYQMKEFRPYSKLSRGQRTLVDLDFIKNLVTNAGIIVFDEILKYLSSGNQIEGLRIINEMNPALKIITSQGENTTYVDHCLYLTYNGLTTEFTES